MINSGDVSIPNFVEVLFDRAYQSLIDIDEVDDGEDRQRNLTRQNQWVLLYRGEVALLGDACENQDLQEYGAAYAA